MNNENNTFSLFAMDRARRRWRFMAILAFIILVFFALPKATNDTPLQDYVARVDIEGFISSDKEQLATLYRLSGDKKVKALMVYVDSPGGTMVGGVDIYTALKRISQTKPVVCVMGTAAASAGYMVTLGCPYVMASPATLTGSIGVFMPLVDATKLAENLGVVSASIASGSLKTATSPLEKQTPEAKAYLQGMVDDLQKTFMSYVNDARTLSQDTKNIIADGRALTGRRALELGLVDALGDVVDAKKWLETKHAIAADTPVRNVPLVQEKSFFEQALSALPFVESISANVGQTAIMATLKP